MLPLTTTDTESEQKASTDCRLVVGSLSEWNVSTDYLVATVLCYRVTVLLCVTVS